MVLQFDGKKVAKKGTNEKNEKNIKNKLLKFRREVTIGNILVGRYFRDFSRILRFIYHPFESISYEFPVWDFVLHFSIYVLFSIVILLSWVGIIFILVTGGIVSGISVTNPFAHGIGTAEIALLIYIQTLFQIFVFLLILLAYHAFILGPNVLVGSFKMFMRSVWLEGWRKILWQSLVVPMVSAFFAIFISWVIFWFFLFMASIFGIILAIYYAISAIVITILGGLLIINGWFAFWRNMARYLYENAGESFSVSFCVLFIAFKGFAALAGIPIIIKIVNYVISYAMFYSIDVFIPIKDTIIGQIIFDVIKSLWETSIFGSILCVLTIIIIVIGLILEVFDLLQLSAAFPKLLRKAMLSGLKYAQEYGEPGYLTVIDLKQSSLESMKFVIIYGAGLAYFAFTIIIVMYIIPSLFNIAIRIF